MKILRALLIYIILITGLAVSAYAEYNSDQSSLFYLDTAHICPVDDGYDSDLSPVFLFDTRETVIVSTTTIQQPVIVSTTTTLPPTILPLAIRTDSLPAGFVEAPYSIWLEAEAGLPPYTWQITFGQLPSGLFLDPSTGQIAGQARVAGQSTFTVQLRDNQSPPAVVTVLLSLNINPLSDLTIITEELPRAYLSSPYQVKLIAVGGLLPYTWQIISGQLPSGLSLNPKSGEILGNPEVAGKYNLTIQVTDNQSFQDRATKSLSIITELSSGFDLTTDAPSFANTRNTLWPYPQDFPTWEVYSYAFGKDNLHWSNGTKKAGANLHWQAIRHPYTGSPFGFTLLSLLCYSRLLSPDDPNLQYANYTYDLSHLIANESSRNMLNKYQLYQYGQQFRDYLVQNRFVQPSQSLQQIKDGFIYGKKQNRGLAIWNRYSGHSLVPYKIENDSNTNSQSRLFVYDCNQPLDQERIVIIDSLRNRWSYNILADRTLPSISATQLSLFPQDQPNLAWPGAQGNEAPTLAFPPIESFLELPHLPAPYGQSDKGYLDVFINSRSDCLIFDKQGNSIGYANNHLIDNLPGAVAIIPIDNGYYDRPPEYFLPSDDYSIKIMNTPGDAYQITIFGQEAIFSLTVGTAAGGTNDYLQLNQNKLTYSSEEANRDFSLTAVLPEDDLEMVYRIDQASVCSLGTATFELGQDYLRYTNQGNTGVSYNLILDLSSQNPCSFTTSSINIGENETHIIKPNDWQNLDQEGIAIQVDKDNNSSVDETINLNEGSQAGLSQILQFKTYNYPNPFNPKEVATTIRYDIPGTGTLMVEIAIYTLSGQRIWTASASKPAGQINQIIWDGRNDEGEMVSSGVYIYVLKAGQYKESKKIAVIK